MTPLYTPRRRRPEINIVPLIDVLTTLIFFFLITMQFKAAKTMSITPPKMDTAGPQAARDVVRIQVSKTGDYFINNQPATPQELKTFLAEAAKRDRESPLLIEADEASQLKELAFILDEARKLGFAKLHLQSR